MILNSIDQRLILACFSRNYNQPLSLKQLELYTYLDLNHLQEVVNQLVEKRLLVYIDEAYYLHNDHYLEMIKEELVLYDQLMQFIEIIKPRIDEVWLIHQRQDQAFDLSKPTLIVETLSSNESFIIKTFEDSNLTDTYQLEISNALKVVDQVSVMDHEVFIENAPITLFIS